MPGEMDGYNCTGSAADMLCNLLRVEIDSLRINIDEYGYSPDPRNGCGGCYEGNRRNDYFIARLDPCRAQGNLQRHRTICQSDAMLGAVIGGKSLPQPSLTMRIRLLSPFKHLRESSKDSGQRLRASWLRLATHLRPDQKLRYAISGSGRARLSRPAKTSPLVRAPSYNQNPQPMDQTASQSHGPVPIGFARPREWHW